MKLKDTFKLLTAFLLLLLGALVHQMMRWIWPKTKWITWVRES